MTNAKYAAPVALALKAHIETLQEDLEIVDVFYGDQVLIPNSPTVCVEPSLTERSLTSTGCAATGTLTCSVLVYDARLGDVQAIQESLDFLTETLANELNQLGTLGGLIVYGFCGRIEYGYLVKSNRLLRADRIIFTATVKTEL